MHDDLRQQNDASYQYRKSLICRKSPEKFQLQGSAAAPAWRIAPGPTTPTEQPRGRRIAKFGSFLQARWSAPDYLPLTCCAPWNPAPAKQRRSNWAVEGLTMIGNVCMDCRHIGELLEAGGVYGDILNGPVSFFSVTCGSLYSPEASNVGSVSKRKPFASMSVVGPPIRLMTGALMISADAAPRAATSDHRPKTEQHGRLLEP